MLVTMLQQRALEPLFSPASVAVVGASEDPTKWGGMLARKALADAHRPAPSARASRPISSDPPRRRPRPRRRARTTARAPAVAAWSPASHNVPLLTAISLPRRQARPRARVYCN